MKKALLFLACSLAMAVAAAAREPDSSPVIDLEAADGLVHAVEDLVNTHGNEYEGGRGYLASARAMRAGIAKGEAVDRGAFSQLQHVALRANPLLVKRPLLFTVHVPDKSGTHNYMHPSGYEKMGSELKILDLATGRSRVLVSAPEGIIRRPCIDFDGTRILFAMNKNRKGNFHVYEIEVDPARLFKDQGEVEAKQLTFAPDASDVDPIYLPDGKIAFCSTRDIKYVPCAKQIVPQLFRMDGDGTNIHQITRSTVHENELSLMPDGRILYSRWDYVDRNFGDGHGFWVSNPDGTNPALLWGNNTANPSAGWTARMIPGTGQILCILGTHHGSLGGAMAILNARKAIDDRESIVRTWPADVITRFDNLAESDLAKMKSTMKKSDRTQIMTSIWPEEARSLTARDRNMLLYAWTDAQKDVKPWYHTPFPLNDKYFLCVRADGRKLGPAIYLVDTFGNELKLHEEEPGCYSPMPLGPLPMPVNIASTRDYQNNDGHFDIQNVYEGTHMQGVEPGSVKYLRVVEALSKRGLSSGTWKGLGAQSPAMSWSDFTAKRILGTVPVENDGSASFYVPSDRFVYFQLLDEDGMMIQSMRSGTSIHSGETRSCIGCHDSRASAGIASAPAIRTLAHRRPPSKLEPWYGEPRAFSYMAEVQPILDKHCLKCHDFGGEGAKKLILAGDKGFAFNASYSELQGKGYTGAIGAGPAGHLPAKSWGSLTSPLIKTLKKGHNDVELDKPSMDRLIAWVDLNGPYYPTTYAARPGTLPGRNPLAADRTTRLAELTGIDIYVIREAHLYTGPTVSFDRPELSPCLASLEKGSDEYLEALSIIQSGKESLAQLPRADMPGFVPYDMDLKRQAHHEKYSRIEQEVRTAIRGGTKVMDSAAAAPDTMGL